MEVLVSERVGRGWAGKHQTNSSNMGRRGYVQGRDEAAVGLATWQHKRRRGGGAEGDSTDG